MPDWLKPSIDSPALPPADLAVRLLLALVAGLAIAWVYRHTRPARDLTPSFPATIVLLAVLIGIVTPVIGNNVGRAFSLVGALSIVRFRTVVRDTQDTAFVIFAVVIGMAIGAGQPVTAAIGSVVVSFAAFLMRSREVEAVVESVFQLNLRVALGQDLSGLLKTTIAPYVRDHRLVSMETSGKGTSIDASYEAHLQNEAAADELLKALQRIEGVQSVGLKRRADEA
jgi:uncharacterized membrane protein YhiD involved in acid resistance